MFVFYSGGCKDEEWEFRVFVVIRESRGMVRGGFLSLLFEVLDLVVFEGSLF